MCVITAVPSPNIQMNNYLEVSVQDICCNQLVNRWITINPWPCKFAKPLKLWCWLVVWNIFIFPYIGNNNPNWLSYFSEGLKPPTSGVNHQLVWEQTDGLGIPFLCILSFWRWHVRNWICCWMLLINKELRNSTKIGFQWYSGWLKVGPS